MSHDEAKKLVPGTTVYDILSGTEWEVSSVHECHGPVNRGRDKRVMVLTKNGFLINPSYLRLVDGEPEDMTDADTAIEPPVKKPRGKK